MNKNYTLTKEWQRSYAIKIVVCCPYCQKEIGYRLKLTPEMIDNVLFLSFTEGSRHWIEGTKILEDEYLGIYDCEQVSRGGRVVLYNRQDKGKYLLDLEKLLTGFYIAVAKHLAISLYNGGEAETYMLNAKTCDEIVQYAVFGDIKYPTEESVGGVYD